MCTFGAHIWWYSFGIPIWCTPIVNSSKRFETVRTAGVANSRTDRIAGSVNLMKSTSSLNGKFSEHDGFTRSFFVESYLRSEPLGVIHFL